MVSGQGDWSNLLSPSAHPFRSPLPTSAPWILRNPLAFSVPVFARNLHSHKCAKGIEDPVARKRVAIPKKSFFCLACQGF